MRGDAGVVESYWRADSNADRGDAWTQARAGRRVRSALADRLLSDEGLEAQLDSNSVRASSGVPCRTGSARTGGGERILGLPWLPGGADQVAPVQIEDSSCGVMTT